MQILLLIALIKGFLQIILLKLLEYWTIIQKLTQNINNILDLLINRIT